MMNEELSKRTTFNIASFRLESFRDQIAKLNRRAVKLGVPAIALRETGNIKEVEIHNEITREVVEVRRFKEVELIGQTPKFQGWTLAATLEHTTEGTIIRKVPDCTVDLAAYRNSQPVCDHCKLARTRKDTYLVAHDNGSVKQIGHNCIHDFLGHQSPQWLAYLAELWYSAGELGSAEEDGFEGGLGGGGEKLVIVDSLLAHTARAVRQYGFVSRKAEIAAAEAGKSVESTKSVVLDWMFPPRDPAAKARIAARYCMDGETWPTPTDADRALVSAAREYVIAKLETKADLNEFESNLLVCAKLEAIEFRTCGIACYLIEYYRRELEGEIKRKEAQAARPNMHFGVVGTRYKGVEVVYRGCHSFETQYGWRYIHKFDTKAEGARLVWKTGTELGLEDGTEGVAAFSVKDQGDYKGWKQTEILRMKLA